MAGDMAFSLEVHSLSTLADLKRAICESQSCEPESFFGFQVGLTWGICQMLQLCQNVNAKDQDEAEAHKHKVVHERSHSQD